MFTALSFLGGTAFRLMFEQVFGFVNRWQENKNELARMQVQSQIDALAHARNLESIKLQSDLGIKTIQVQAEGRVADAEWDAFAQGVRNTAAPTGVRWVDGWNGAIRPSLATISIVLWLVSVATAGWVLGDWDKSLIGLALGIFVGGRIIATGK